MFPRHQLPELRRPRYTWYKMRLNARMARLRLWWLAAAALQLVAIGGRVSACTEALRQASSESSGGIFDGGQDSSGIGAAWLLCLQVMTGVRGEGGVAAVGASLPLMLLNFWLDVAPIVMGCLAAVTICMWRTSDFTSRQFKTAWLWPNGQAGEMPHQRLPDRILSQKRSIRAMLPAQMGLLPELQGKKSALRAGLGAASAAAAVDAGTDGVVEGGDGGAVAGSSPSSSSAAATAALPGGAGTIAAAPPSFFRPMRIVILTIGTRGDVQPYIALATHMRDSGHSVAISTTRDFREMIEKAGLEYCDAGADRIPQPEEWLSVKSTAEFMTVTAPILLREYDAVADSFHRACMHPVRADVIIGTAMTVTFALNISQACGIPCWVAKLAPDIPTAGYVTPGHTPSQIGWLNLGRCFSYWLKVADAARRIGVTDAENAWRQRSLGLNRIVSTERIDDMTYTPQLLGFSEYLFPKPVDYPQWAFEVGFWTSGSGDVHSQKKLIPRQLRDFMELPDPTYSRFRPLLETIFTTLRTAFADKKYKKLDMIDDDKVIIIDCGALSAELKAAAVDTINKIVSDANKRGRVQVDRALAAAAAAAAAGAAGTGAAPTTPLPSEDGATDSASAVPQGHGCHFVIAQEDAILQIAVATSRMPIAVVTFGSMINSSRPDLLADIVSVLLQRRLKVLVLTGWRSTPPVLPADPHVLCWDEAPHDWLFRYSHFVVHHGGAGTTARALASGIPSVIIPVLRWADQPLWGHLVSDLAVGSMVTEENPTKEQIARAVTRVLRGNMKVAHLTGAIMGDRANRVGAFVRAERSADTALALLESCLCNLVLPPAHADAIHPSNGPILNWSGLTKEQKMCVRNCVPCRRLRVEGHVIAPMVSSAAAGAGAASSSAAGGGTGERVLSPSPSSSPSRGRAAGATAAAAAVSPIAPVPPPEVLPAATKGRRRRAHS